MLRVDVAQVLNPRRQVGPQHLEPDAADVVSGHLRIEGIARLPGFAGVNARVAGHQVVPREEPRRVFDVEREEAHARHAAAMREPDGRMVRRPAAGADKPFAFAAQADQAPRADRQPIEHPHRFRRGHHQRRGRTQARAHRDVPADHHVQAAQPAVAKQLLQAEDGGFDVVGPVAARRFQQALEARAVNHPLPIVPVQAGHQVGNAEGLLRELRARPCSPARPRRPSAAPPPG